MTVPTTEHRRVLVDCDPATGVPRRDVDDGLALLVLLAAPHVSVEAVTVTRGNVPVDVGVGVATDLLARIGVNLPVLRGAEGRADLGRSSPAVDHLIESVRNSPGELSLLALGPLTNVASAMALDPTFAGNLRELVVMGGSLGFRPFSHLGELNFHLDGPAARTVLRAPTPVALVTMDACRDAVFRQEQLDRIADRSGPMADYLTGAIAPWLRLNRRVFFRAKGFFPWDVVAAARLIDPTMFDRRLLTLDVQPGGLRSGRISTVLPAWDHADRSTQGVLDVPAGVDRARFLALFMAGLMTFC